MAKFVAPGAQMTRPASPVNTGLAVAPVQSAMLKAVDDMEERMQEIQYLRARVQNVNGQASSGSAASFGWLAGFIASVGLAASVGVAAVKKYSGHGQSESTLGSHISL